MNIYSIHSFDKSSSNIWLYSSDYSSDYSNEERIDSTKKMPQQHGNPLGSKCIPVTKIMNIKDWRIRKCLAM